MAKSKKITEAAPEPAALVTENQQPEQTDSVTPEHFNYEIVTTFDTLIQTNDNTEAHAKLEQVKDTSLPKFTFIDRVLGVMWVYEKESYQKNYRVTPSDFPPATPVV